MQSVLDVIQRIRAPLSVVRGDDGAVGVAEGIAPPERLLVPLGPVHPEWLGDPSFLSEHRVRFPYVAGAMANGIATRQMVLALARRGILGFFGAAGLPPAEVEQNVRALSEALEPRGLSWGSNLIHSPTDPALEDRIVDLYLDAGVRRVSASAFMALTPSVVRVAAKGLSRGPDGRIRRARYVFAKVSRAEVAAPFMSPAPPDILQTLVDRGQLTRAEADLAARIPVASDITCEADSGGHTDNRALTALLPTLIDLRDRKEAALEEPVRIRIGAAGGIGTPGAVAAAFAIGADYVLTGSVNQACVEAGLSVEAKEMLGRAESTDVDMAAAADMFELGVEVQVLKRGTMFAARANRLYELYRRLSSLEDLTEAERRTLEDKVFRAPLDRVWAQTEAFWRDRSPGELDRAAKDPKHRMALLFRTYLGLSSRWAIVGEVGRAPDFQIWCGPAMGAFNDWVRGSFLEPLEARTVTQVALNLMEGAAVLTRAQQLRAQGVPLPPGALRFTPRPLEVDDLLGVSS